MNSLAIPRPVKSGNHWNRTCLTRWNKLKISKSNTSCCEEIREKRETKSSISISLEREMALGLHQTIGRAIILKWRNFGTVVAYQNYSKSGLMTHPGSHKRTSKDWRRYLPQSRSVFMIQQEERDWARMAAMAEVQGENHWIKRRAQRFLSH